MTYGCDFDCLKWKRDGATVLLIPWTKHKFWAFLFILANYFPSLILFKKEILFHFKKCYALLLETYIVIMIIETYSQVNNGNTNPKYHVRMLAIRMHSNCCLSPCLFFDFYWKFPVILHTTEMIFLTSRPSTLS